MLLELWDITCLFYKLLDNWEKTEFEIKKFLKTTRAHGDAAHAINNPTIKGVSTNTKTWPKDRAKETIFSVHKWKWG